MPTKQPHPLRFEREKVCKECREYGYDCAGVQRCASVRGKLKPYSGIRLTADGFDCALPLTIDSHSVCSYACLYCFSDNITGHSYSRGKRPHIGQTPLGSVESIFRDRDLKDDANWRFKKALRYDRRNAGGYPCPVQVGGLCDPCDSIEQTQGWLLDFLDLCIKYEQPARLSTKGGALMLPEYLEKLKKAPHLFWVAFSMITDDDDLLAKIDRYTLTASQRLEVMAKLSSIGVNTSLRFRPILLGVSDRDGAYKRLIQKAAKAGAQAVSYEVMFYPQAIPRSERWKWDLLEDMTGYQLRAMYRGFGKPQSCMRPPFAWTEDIMHAVRDEAHRCGMRVGVSDPVWKQLTDCGSCCGIPPDHPVFGNWEVENATNALMRARDGHRDGIVHLADIVPPWAGRTPVAGLVNPGVGPDTVGQYKHYTWGDHLKDLWNNPTRQRSPMNYFQGALQVHGEDAENNLTYKYVGLQRQHLKTHWQVGAH